MSQLSPLLNLDKEERRQVAIIRMSIVQLCKDKERIVIVMTMTLLQVMEWMDLERNAAILEKTDKAIAQKLRAASGGKVIDVKMLGRGHQMFCTQCNGELKLKMF